MRTCCSFQGASVTRGELVSGSLVQEFFLLLFLQVGGPILVDLNGKFGKFAQPNPGGETYNRRPPGFGRKKGGAFGSYLTNPVKKLMFNRFVSDLNPQFSSVFLVKRGFSSTYFM